MTGMEPHKCDCHLPGKFTIVISGVPAYVPGGWTEAGVMISNMNEEIPLLFPVAKAERLGDRCVRELERL